MNGKIFYIRFLCLFFSMLFLQGVLFGQKNDTLQNLIKPKNRIYVIAHRGAHQGIPENSIPAYQKAIDLGCDFVEIDIRTTKDGRFVSVHNSTIDNYVIGKAGNVKELTLAEIKGLDIGEKLAEKWKGTQIPTLEEILKLCKGKIGIYLDLKDAPVPELMKIIGEYDMENDVVWYIPFSQIARLENSGNLFGNSWLMPDPQNESNLKELLETGKFKIIATDMDVLTPAFIGEAHKKGAMVFVDEKEGNKAEWQKMTDWGCNGIQTDKPADLIEMLKQK
jgi:glycerophosphoryl diester phosphodiesterase